jgi:hypothetical protein
MLRWCGCDVEIFGDEPCRELNFSGHFQHLVQLYSSVKLIYIFRLAFLRMCNTKTLLSISRTSRECPSEEQTWTVRRMDPVARLAQPTWDSP